MTRAGQPALAFGGNAMRLVGTSLSRMSIGGYTVGIRERVASALDAPVDCGVFIQVHRRLPVDYGVFIQVHRRLREADDILGDSWAGAYTSPPLVPAIEEYFRTEG